MKQTGKEKVKISLFADDMIVCISNPQVQPKNSYILTKNFSKIAGYKLNSNKSVFFLYTNDK